ncbi:hypothetical protein AB0F76_34270 [Streptomyces aureus]
MCPTYCRGTRPPERCRQRPGGQGLSGWAGQGASETSSLFVLAAADLGQITRGVKRKLKMLQYRPEIIDGCLVGAGPTLSG